MKFLNFNKFLNFYCKKNNNKVFYLSDSKKKQLTYSDLLIILNKFGYFLKKLQINKNDKIVVILDNSVDLVLIFLSLLFNNRIFVPINPNSSVSEVNYIINKTNPKILIIHKDLELKFKSIKKKKIILDSKIFWRKVNKIKTEREFNLNFSSKSVAQILFTSGSTGRPKGVILTHLSMLENLFGIINSLKIFIKNPKFLSVTPLYHNNGQFIPTLTPIVLGGSTMSISPDSSLINFWPVCQQFGINYSSVMATHINYFNSIKKITKHNLKCLYCGGAKLDRLSQIKFEKKFKIKILCNYGLTETSSIASTESLNDQFKYGSVGKPLCNNKIKILKKRNKLGEILIKGNNLFKEYLSQKKLTKLKYLNGWFKTGDLGYLDKDGYLFVRDRIDNMIIVSGENIYPSEIENHIYKLKKIKLGVVTSIPDSMTQNKLILVYESKKRINNEEFYNFMMDKIVKFKIPKLLIHINDLKLKEIPKAPNKKILRNKLKLIVQKFLFKHFN